MQVKDILSAITTYREERGWTEYQLAERSGLPQSTISSWYRKNMVPTIPSLEKICMAFGITLSQLFAERFLLATKHLFPQKIVALLYLGAKVFHSFSLDND